MVPPPLQENKPKDKIYGNKEKHLAENSANRNHCVNRNRNHLRDAILHMSCAVLHSNQYQNHRRIELIIVHCSATRCTSHIPLDAIIAWHQAQGFATIGYHYYITQDGDVHCGRPLHQEGAHAVGYNKFSIGVCYEGGLNAEGSPADTRTPEQKASMMQLLRRLKTDYPHAKIVGHRDLPGVKKECPCFDVNREYAPDGHR